VLCNVVQWQMPEKQFLISPPFDPNFRKVWMNFTFNRVQDRFSKIVMEKTKLLKIFVAFL